MSQPRDDASVGELFERLSTDTRFRAAFRLDPGAACRALGLEQLADRFQGQDYRAQRLAARESRSALASLLVAGLIDVAGDVQQLDGPDPGATPSGVPAAANTDASPGATGSPAAHTGQVAVLSEALTTRPPRQGTPYPGDDAPRQQIATWMADEAQRHGLPRELPVMAALVESELRNLSYGDRASVGYFQMQTTYWLERYPDYPNKPDLQVKWFIDQALRVRAAQPDIARDPQRWGEWVADIEQPRSDLRGKYTERLAEARALVAAGQLDAPAQAGVVGPGASPSQALRPFEGTAAAVAGAREPVAAAPVARGHEALPPPVASNPTGASGVLATTSNANDVQRVRVISPDQSAPHTGSQPLVGPEASAAGPADGTVEALKAEAKRIDDARVPYLWGGGHAGRQPHVSAVTPLDCSGAVSRVLGINPRVSGDLESWGAPGPGKRVTIFANDQHVLMEIDGHFWGTSATNPGGGAGWIPRRLVGDAYLTRFTQRHPPGQ